MYGPGAHLTDHDITIGDRASVPGQHQLGDRLQVDHVGLDPTPTLHTPLLGDLSGIELQHLPPLRPPMVEHRAVIMASRLHTDLTRPAGGTTAVTRAAAAVSPDPVIANSDGPTSR